MAPTPTLEYLRQDIPPCDPIAGSDLDPCEADVPGGASTIYSHRPPFGEPITVRQFLGHGSNEGIFASHLVVRGTYVPDSLRCINQQRDRPSNIWSIEELNTLGLGDVDCYVDMRVGSYILGTGPASLTVLVKNNRTFYGGEPDEPRVERTINEFETILKEGGSDLHLHVTDGGILGREVIVFLSPYANTAVETWQVRWPWDVQRRAEDGVTTVIAVHPQRDSFRSANPTGYQTYKDTHLELPLPSFAQKVTAASQQRVAEYGGRTYVEEGETYPMLVTDANNLQRFIRDVGGYDDPDDQPLQPPPVYAPPPATLTATATGEETANFSWAAVTGATGYQIQHRFRGDEPWAVLASVTGAGHSTAALWCDRVYEFRAGAHGDGTTYNTRVGRWSPVATATTSTCTAQAPKFFNEPFAYDVSIGAVAGVPTGSPDAIDLNGDTIAYSITAGNEASKFAINAATGAITVRDRLRAPLGTAYTLTLSAADGVSGAATATADHQGGQGRLQPE